MLVLKALTGSGTGHMLSQLINQSRSYGQAAVSWAEVVFFPTEGDSNGSSRNKLQCAFPVVRGEAWESPLGMRSWWPLTMDWCQFKKLSGFSYSSQSSPRFNFTKLLFYCAFVPSSVYCSWCHRVACIISTSVPAPCPTHTSGFQSIPAGKLRRQEPKAQMSPSQEQREHDLMYTYCSSHPLFPYLHSSGPNPGEWPHTHQWL